MQHHLRGYADVAAAPSLRYGGSATSQARAPLLLRPPGGAHPFLPGLLHRRDDRGTACEPGSYHGAENEVELAEERVPNQLDSQVPRPRNMQGLTRSFASSRARWG